MLSKEAAVKQGIEVVVLTMNDRAAECQEAMVGNVCVPDCLS